MSPNPSTIILALWRDATAAATEELKISYATKYPRAKIFLLRGGGEEEENKQQQQQLLLADDDNHNHDNDNNDDHLLLSPTKKSILIHISDHHAATQICQFLRTYLSRTGKILDVGTVIFDQKNIPQPSTSLRRWWILPFSLLWCWWSSNFISFLAIWISRRMVGGGGRGDESLYCRWTWIRHDFVDGGILPGDVRLEFLGRKSMKKKKEKEERNGDDDDDDDGCEEELLIGGGVWFSDWRG